MADKMVKRVIQRGRMAIGTGPNKKVYGPGEENGNVVELSEANAKIFEHMLRPVLKGSNSKTEVPQAK